VIIVSTIAANPARPVQEKFAIVECRFCRLVGRDDDCVDMTIVTTLQYRLEWHVDECRDPLRIVGLVVVRFAGS
jgi:hypothetical protein